jgi:hypothetical protein
MTEFRTFGCTNCGTPFPAVQPDDIHVVVLSTPCPKGDSLEVTYDCKNCHQTSTRYWDKKHEKFEDDFRRMANVTP